MKKASEQGRATCVCLGQFCLGQGCTVFVWYRKNIMLQRISFPNHTPWARWSNGCREVWVSFQSILTKVWILIHLNRRLDRTLMHAPPLPRTRARQCVLSVSVGKAWPFSNHFRLGSADHQVTFNKAVPGRVRSSDKMHTFFLTGTRLFIECSNIVV
jgi:hypothetical protein